MWGRQGMFFHIYHLPSANCFLLYSLIRRFVDDRFTHNEAATIGFDFKPYQMVVDGRTIQFNIWVNVMS